MLCRQFLQRYKSNLFPHILTSSTKRYKLLSTHTSNIFARTPRFNSSGAASTDMAKQCPPIIGVLGGVGPMAGVLFHTKIIENTRNVHCDQDHLSVMHFSLSKYIGDRTGYLAQVANKDQDEKDGKELKNPGASMGRLAHAMTQAAINLESQMIVCVPCNTFHSPLVWNAFVECINNTNKETEEKVGKNLYNSSKIGHLQVVHMIELTLNDIQSNNKGIKNVGLMCTNGTRNTKLYDSIAMDKFGINILQVDDETQKELHNAIYDPNDGIKTLSRASPRVRGLYESFVKQLKNDKKCDVAILGCTEIPIVLPEDKLFGVSLVDPMTVMAKHVVNLAKDISNNSTEYAKL